MPPVTDGDHAKAAREDDHSLSRPRTSEAHPPRPRTGTAVSHGAQGVHHQHFVLADPVAFSYLEEDPSVLILDRGRFLEGYQCYVVEQWACSRSHPTFVVIAWTGDSSNKIKVGVLSVPADEASWSPRLKVYFRTLAQYHARRRDTPLGTVLVTNLSGFPSSLTIINVPDGDVRKHREDFVVNENLKRLGCSGRVGISIQPPTPAAEAKFHQLYRTSGKIDLYKSVIELVKLCQAALMLFDILKPEYADGLLCDVTEKAVNDWWADFGYEYYKTEPSDGILGPTTVAALIGTLTGARNRLHVLGAPVAKDVFDIESTKRAINHFQKSQHLHKTRRLDRQTLDALHKITAKQAATEGRMVPRAVRSTMAELSGKGGEMVMDMVGRERSALAEAETTDIERLAQLVKGERARWLWQGRARKRTTRDLFDEHPGQMSLKQDDDFGVASPQMADRDALDDQPPLERGPKQASQKHTRTPTADISDPRKTVLNRAKGRLRGATFVKRGHQSTASRDVNPQEPTNKSYESLASTKSELLIAIDSPAERPENLFDEHASQSRQGSDRNHKREGSRLRGFAPKLSHRFDSSKNGSRLNVAEALQTPQQELQEPINLHELDHHASAVVNTEMSLAQDVAGETDLEAFDRDERPAQSTGALLLRTTSFSKYVEDSIEKHNRQRWPGHLSFSALDELLNSGNDEWWSDDDASHASGAKMSELQSEPPSPNADAEETADLTKVPREAFRREKGMESKQRRLREELSRLGRADAAWLMTQLDEVAVIESTATQDVEQMQQLFAPRKEEQEALHAGSQEVLKEERARLGESIRDLETFGQRVEYEIEGLRGKVEDMESSVNEFEKQVAFVEDRVRELTRAPGAGRESRANGGATKQAEVSWARWLRNVFSGIKDQKDFRQALSEVIKETEAKAEAAVRDASETNPLTAAPKDNEARISEKSTSTEISSG